MSDNQHGPTYAKVSDNKDPQKLGRVKVTYSFMGSETESGWCDVLNLFGGSFYIPDKGDQVVVAFFGGSPSKGVVLGCVWTPENKPPESGENSGSDFNKDGKNTLRHITTAGGNKIIIDDKKGDEKIQILNAKSSNRIELLVKSKKIKIKSKEKLSIDGGRMISFAADKGEYKFSKGLTIKAESINFKAKEKINTKASKDIKFKGNTVKLN